MKESAAALFRETYGAEPASVAVAPGRINIIGEHVDYAGGLCLPAAVDRYLAVAAAPGPGFRAASELFPGQDLVADLAALRPTGGWADHCLGVLSELVAEGVSPDAHLA